VKRYQRTTSAHDLVRAILLKVSSALVFAIMAVLVRYLGERYPVGQVVFFRSAFAIVPVVIIYAWRRELEAAVRTGRPLRHLGRGLTAMGAMFCNFSALARLPVVDATAISFLSPLMTVALSAIFLKERVRFYRWSAVILGFGGVLLMLAPQLDFASSHVAATALVGAAFGFGGAFFAAASNIQTRAMTASETTSSIVLYFSLICAIGGLATWPFGWQTPSSAEIAMLVGIGICGGVGHILLTESYRRATASVIAPFDYTSMLWTLLLGFVFLSEIPSLFVIAGVAVIAAAGLLVIWRERLLRGKRGRIANSE